MHLLLLIATLAFPRTAGGCWVREPASEAVRNKDVGAGRVTAESVATPVETLTLTFAPATGNATELVVEWEKTRVRIPIRRASS